MNKRNKDIKPLDYGVLKETLPKSYKSVLTQEVVDEMNLLSADPDYGQQFIDSIIDYSHILGNKSTWSMNMYLDAIKYYSLTAVALSQVDAYVKVFPERLKSRLDRGQTKNDMRGEASRFNSSELVNAIRKQALVPLHLVNQGITQKAINQLAHLMLNARSDVAKVSAATALLKELKPPEAQKIELDIGVKDNDAIADLKTQLADIADAQLKAVDRDQVSVKQLGALKPKDEFLEAELDE